MSSLIFTHRNNLFAVYFCLKVDNLCDFSLFYCPISIKMKTIYVYDVKNKFSLWYHMIKSCVVSGFWASLHACIEYPSWPRFSTSNGKKNTTVGSCFFWDLHIRLNKISSVFIILAFEYFFEKYITIEFSIVFFSKLSGTDELLTLGCKNFFALTLYLFGLTSKILLCLFP